MGLKNDDRREFLKTWRPAGPVNAVKETRTFAGLDGGSGETRRGWSGQGSALEFSGVSAARDDNNQGRKSNYADLRLDD